MVSQWVLDRCGFEAAFSFAWYPAAYDTFFMSIMPAGDVLQHIPREKRDVAILEEPEHLSWFNRSFRWSLEFNHVIGEQAVTFGYAAPKSQGGADNAVHPCAGIMHTNYVDYVRRDAGNPPTRTPPPMHGRADIRERHLGDRSRRPYPGLQCLSQALSLAPQASSERRSCGRAPNGSRASIATRSAARRCLPQTVEVGRNPNLTVARCQTTHGSSQQVVKWEEFI